MNISDIGFYLRDNGGRRLENERRQFLYSGHIPERRSEKDRRSIDRRSGLDRRAENDKVINLLDRRVFSDRRSVWNEMIVQYNSI